MKSAMQNSNTTIIASSNHSHYSSVMMKQLLVSEDITSWETLSVCALTCGVALLSLIYFLLDKRFTFLIRGRGNSQNHLPGPWGFPVLGHLPLLGAMPHLTLMHWVRKYGNVFQIRLGFRKAIVINGSKLIRETLIQRGTDFAGRPNFPSFKLVNNGQGMIFNSYSPSWQVKRTIMQKAVGKYLTNGSEFLHLALNEHGSAMIEELIKTSSHQVPVDPATILLRHSSRLFFNILVSDFQVDKVTRYEQVDQLIDHFQKIMKLSSYTALSDIYPALQIFFPKQIEEFKKINDIITNNLKNEQQTSLETFNSERTRDITDALIMAKDNISQDDLKNAGLLDSKENNSRTLALLGDLLGAGQSTVASTLKWLLLHMATFPDVQNKVRNEITRNDSDDNDFLDAKLLHAKYPYCVATVLESQRFAVLFPMLVPHATTVNTEIDGYKVEKNTIVIFNIWSASRDSDEWSEPEKFKPERFLTDDGLELDKNRVHAFPAFGIGRRRCLGEQLGSKAVNYFFLRIMKSCRISLPLNKQQPSLSGVFGFSLDPEPYTLTIQSTTD